MSDVDLKPLSELAPTFFVSPFIGMPRAMTIEVLLQARKGMGISFDCPCGCGERRQVAFLNPLDGGPAAASEFPIFARVSMADDTWQGLSLESVHFGSHGRWAIDRGQVVPVLG